MKEGTHCDPRRLCALSDGTLGECKGHGLMEELNTKEALFVAALQEISDLKKQLASLKETCNIKL